MTYAPPKVGPAGLSIPTYQDILDGLVENFKSVYGQDVYLGNDSADFQFLAILATFMSDNFQAIQLAYNNTSPATAIGAGLDRVVKVNGLNRKPTSPSTVTV